MVIIKKAAPGISQQALQRFSQRARTAAGVRGQVTVVLTSSREMRALNRRFRGHDKPTDVLSFPPPVWPGSSARVQKSKSRVASLPLELAGDIVISADIAVRNARRYRHSSAQELKVLILHGMLHLAGYDHESDHGQMARREERLRRELGLGDGLIRRAEQCGSGPRSEHAVQRPVPDKRSARRTP